MAGFYLIGLNHASAPVEVRERFAGLCVSGLPGADGRAMEAVTVLTCNRVEAYFYGDAAAAQAMFAAWLASENRSWSEIEPYAYRCWGRDVVRHLLLVAAGLDSMVLGEQQILHQVKASYQAAAAAGSVGKHLHALFQRALEVGKRVRAETRISENTVSIASAAVEMARSIFGPLDRCTALVVGAGEMAGLVARQMRDRGVGALLFANRTPARAEELARLYGGRAASLADLAAQLAQADVLISSTGAPRPVITRELLAEVMAARHDRPLFAIDIAVPRDIEPECADLENVFLYDIDDLQQVVDESLELRRQESPKVEAIIDEELARFDRSLETFAVAPLLAAVRARADEIRRAELDRIFPASRPLPADLRADLERLTRALMGKWLHHPMITLKERAQVGADELAVLARLFGLDPSALASSDAEATSEPVPVPATTTATASATPKASPVSTASPASPALPASPAMAGLAVASTVPDAQAATRVPPRGAGASAATVAAAGDTPGPVESLSERAPTL
ncbi:MAG: Glutamyl-tRNA reductase [Candidatus Ozemobacter sibiricus]|jgi:glutamyl-tRNA reductase|uniref:Glutamyl-tRNA reductase n=1 Tax=Candidatus Ozemobacter sibiricus TaxID=2268124 RepID=A0A367ZRK3_9BACT|nr:MAG: Glutamyl-tRNA reductase [Candidatus Ozemobacter sibiricus]